MKHRVLRRRYGHSSGTTEFKHLIPGHWFRFASEDDMHHPWVKVSRTRYVSALAPNDGPKYQHTARASAPVRHATSYPTHAFPEGGR
jgi:hypothetical protein